MQRPHPVTGRTLAGMLDEERPYLQALPRVPYDTRDVVQHHVDSTAHILYENEPSRSSGSPISRCSPPAAIPPPWPFRLVNLVRSMFVGDKLDCLWVEEAPYAPPCRDDLTIQLD
jgi:hypothetical protein